MPKRGCGVIFFDVERQRILIFLRDDKAGIPYPGMLDIVGGGVEEGETPDEALIRELEEELVDLRTGRPFRPDEVLPFKVYTDEAGTEQSIYCAPATFEIEDLRLLEGQRLVWLRRKEAATVMMAFGFGGVVREFFASAFMERRKQ